MINNSNKEDNRFSVFVPDYRLSRNKEIEKNL